MVENFAEKFTLVFEHVNAHLESAPGCHDFEHTLRVLHHARVLASLIKSDLEIVELAALLHDIARPEELSSKGKCCHAKIGCEMARNLVFEVFRDATLAAAVGEAVRTHRYRGKDRPQTVEAKIVFDADKLDSLGAIGIGRAFLFAGRENARLHNTCEEALNSAAYSREDTAYREFLVKLCKLPGVMQTAEGKKIAQKRLRFMEKFFAELSDEIYCAGTATVSGKNPR